MTEKAVRWLQQFFQCGSACGKECGGEEKYNIDVRWPDSADGKVFGKEETTEDNLFFQGQRTGQIQVAQVAAIPGAYFNEAPLRAPRLRSFQSFSSAPSQQLLGVPIFEGSLWHLSMQDQFEPVVMQLHVNGIAFSTSDGHEVSLSFSPFSMVRNCRFQTGDCAKLKSFKLSAIDYDPCCYFAAWSSTAPYAEEERSDWVLKIANSILLITDSIMPRVRSISCDPVPGQPRTNLRLLAGHLIHKDDTETLSVLFCELTAPSGGAARLVLYEDEQCNVPIMDILIQPNLECTDIVGINCSCFEVGGHCFAAHTPSERKLWLRALSNLKVKLQNGAPEPTDQDLLYYREAVREQILHLEAGADPRISDDPLLLRASGKAMHIVGMGDMDAEPSSYLDYEQEHFAKERLMGIPERVRDGTVEAGLVPPRPTSLSTLPSNVNGLRNSVQNVRAGDIGVDPFLRYQHHALPAAPKPGPSSTKHML